MEDTRFISDDVVGSSTWDLSFNTTLFLVASTILVITVFIYNSFPSFEGWEKYGVKQAKVPMLEVPTLQYQRLMKQHGPTVGIFRGSPILVTRDLDIVKQVTIKDFNNFPDRMDKLITKSPIGQGVFFLKGQDWKRIRQLMSPSFSTGKLKQMSSHVTEAAESLAKYYETCARTGSTAKVIHSTGQYTASIIAKTAFGAQVDSIGQEEDDQFTLSAKMFFKTRSKIGLLIIVFMIGYSRLRKFLLNYFNVTFLDLCSEESTNYFNAVLKDSVKVREEAELGGGRRRNDFLQSLISVKVATDATAAKMEKNQPQNGTAVDDTRPKKTLTTDEVVSQSFMTILAAFETTSTTLHFCLYKLAQHPDIQEKVYQEIRDVVGHDHPTHEHLQAMPYLEHVINETLRLFPPLSNITRLTRETRTYGDVTIPAGAGVVIPILQIHLDPKNYPNPEIFDPERFSEENRAKRDPLAFQPFGAGPRLCIGMRLAYLEMKMALVFVLQKVRLELNDVTVPRKGEEVTLVYQALTRPEKPIEVAATLRENA